VSETKKITVSPARAAAFHILMSVGEGAHSDDLIFSPAVTALSDADKNLTMALVMGVLRWEPKLDTAIGALLDRPMQKMSAEVSIALRLGLFQLWYLDRIPDHAAISESVELCRVANAAYATGMVNAVLRKLARMKKPQPEKRKLVVTAKFLAAEYAHPEWMVARWMKNYGAVATEKILAADQTEPSDGAEYFTESAGPEIDAGSRLIAEMAAVGEAKRILDCCAAPGGKTMVLAMRRPEAEITAADNSAERLQRMEQRLRKAQAKNVRCVQEDAARLDAAAKYERILCDVPCTGTGTLARNPEIKYRLRAADLSMQAKRQRGILTSALKALEAGGRLVYSTCSLEPEENEQVVESVLAEVKNVRVIPAGEVLRELEQAGVLKSDAAAMLSATAVRGDYLRTLPGVHACDGFFAAVIGKS